MDASEYLRKKKAAQTNYIHRQVVMDASLHTYILGKAANRTYVSPATSPVSTTKPNCCAPIASPLVTTAKGFSSSYTTPVKPASACESAAMCAQLTDVYTTPYISTPCCTYTLPTASYVSKKPCACYQATPEHSKAYSAVVANKERGLCCAGPTTPQNDPPS